MRWPTLPVENASMRARDMACCCDGDGWRSSGDAASGLRGDLRSWARPLMRNFSKTAPLSDHFSFSWVRCLESDSRRSCSYTDGTMGRRAIWR